MSLSKEQIESLMTRREPISFQTMDAIFLMALSSIAMREALKPFADAAASLRGHEADEWSVQPLFTAGDLRRAFKAYQEQGK